MWKIIVCEVLVFCLICGIGGDTEEGGGIISGPLLIITGIIAWIFRDKLQGTLYWYAICSWIMGVFQFTSSLCPNIRDMLLGIAIGGGIGYFSFRNFLEHRVLATIGFIIAFLAVVGSIYGSIDNIKAGINPDIVAKEKAEKRKMYFKIAKLAVKVFGKL